MNFPQTIRSPVSDFGRAIEAQTEKVCTAYLSAAVRQHSFHETDVGVGNHHINIQVTLPLRCLGSQNVSRVRVPTLHFTGRGQTKSLRRAFVCFKLWH
jgi:hypothetical protein